MLWMKWKNISHTAENIAAIINSAEDDKNIHVLF